MKSLEHYWYKPNIFIWLLLPLSWLYCLITIIRRKLYQLNLLKSFAVRTPVVIIGNIVAGGSGKTPLLISLCEFIQNKGLSPGVVSRGYGGNVSGVKQVTADDTAELVGDEPLMIFQRTKVPVVVAADRVAAVNYLLENNHCDVVLSDDGLQHYRMQRDLEIAVVDANREFGNEFCLPAGPLRERLSRLNDVDIIVQSNVQPDIDGQCSYRLQTLSVNQLNGGQDRSLSSFANATVHAVAGIGHPARFFDQLRHDGVEIIEHEFPDHYVYQQSDFSGWHEECIIMTEKDAVKCRKLNLPDAWVLTVNAVFSEELESKLASTLLPLLERQQ